MDEDCRRTGINLEIAIGFSEEHEKVKDDTKKIGMKNMETRLSRTAMSRDWVTDFLGKPRKSGKDGM